MLMITERWEEPSSILKYFDRMNDNAVIVATTNLFEHLDRALLRRFDSIVDFNRYTNEDLMEIAENSELLFG